MQNALGKLPKECSAMALFGHIFLYNEINFLKLENFTSQMFGVGYILILDYPFNLPSVREQTFK